MTNTVTLPVAIALLFAGKATIDHCEMPNSVDEGVQRAGRPAVAR